MRRPACCRKGASGGGKGAPKEALSLLVPGEKQTIHAGFDG